jgi:DNA-binding NarL/FixJ family response regulator
MIDWSHPARSVSADSGVEALTARELEIADLVTDRKTNAEIAADLFLGVSSRVAVAKPVERERVE